MEHLGDLNTMLMNRLAKIITNLQCHNINSTGLISTFSVLNLRPLLSGGEEGLASFLKDLQEKQLQEQEMRHGVSGAPAERIIVFSFMHS